MEWVDELISRYRTTGIVVDTNILVLLFVGSVGRELIERFKRTQQFAPEDYDTLVALLSHFQQVVTTPNILTEVSNLCSQLGEPARSACMELIRVQTHTLEEHYLPTREVREGSTFVRLGLTDAVTIQLGKRSFLTLTDDFALSQSLQSEGADALNFNHVRTFGWR